MSELPDNIVLGGAPEDPDMPDYVRAVYTSVKNTWQDAENLDDTHSYISYIWIPEETFKVDIMKLWVFAEKFRAYSKSALAGGAQTKTSAAGGSHSHTVTGATSSATSPNHTHGIVGDTGEPSERVTVLTYQVRELLAHDGGNLIADWVSLNGAAGGYHIHNYGSLTTESGGASHTHTVSGQTAEAVTDHTHTVTISDHTHEIDFGIYEEAITGRTLSAILYDPDGNVLKDFGVVLTGEGNEVINLSSYFATLAYGMYRMVLSASGRLRARLVFYELCKMYAQY